jgi:hypothetical protein
MTPAPSATGRGSAASAVLRLAVLLVELCAILSTLAAWKGLQ